MTSTYQPTEVDVVQPALYDVDGNISVQANCGAVIEFEFEDAAQVPMAMDFIVPGVLLPRVVMVSDGPLQFKVVLTGSNPAGTGDVDLLSRSPKAFVLRDLDRVEGGVVVPEPLWEGLISKRTKPQAPIAESDPAESVIIGRDQNPRVILRNRGPRGLPGADANVGFAVFLPDRMPPPTQAVLTLLMPQAVRYSRFYAASNLGAASPVNMLIQRRTAAGLVSNIGSIAWPPGDPLTSPPVVTFIPTDFAAGDALVIPPVPVRDLTLADIALAAS